jgi:PKD repeat protein
VSLTDRCNYRCTYCMPDRPLAHDPRSSVLSLEEIERVCAEFARWGVERVRLTGGEPTLRRGLVELVARLTRLSVGDGPTPARLQVTLTTNGETTITVTAGTKTATATVTGRPGPSVVLTCSVTGGTGSGCATATVGQTVVFTASRESGSAQLTSATLDFGDNSSQSLGTLNSSTNVPHVYSQPGTYTARLTGTDTNGETSSTIQVVQVNAVAITVAASVTSGTTVSATATVNSPATNYLWNWGDSTSSSTTGATAQRTYAAPGTYTITVTATLQSGGTVTGSATVVVP